MRRSLVAVTFLLAIGIGPASGQLSGTYTVGGDSPDFETPQEAADSLMAQGVSGPVQIQIRPGIYESGPSGDGRVLVIDRAIAGISAAARVTFRSDVSSGGSSTNVILKRRTGGNVILIAPTAGASAVSHITLEAVTVATEDVVAGVNELEPVIDLAGRRGGPSVTGLELIGVNINGSARRAGGIRILECGEDIRLIRNQIDGAAYALDLFCRGADGLRIEENRVENSGYTVGGCCPLYLTVLRVRAPASSNVSIVDNVVDMTGRCSHIAIGAEGDVSGIRVERNHVINHACGGGDGSGAGGSIAVSGGVGRTVVANNMVSLGTNGTLFRSGGPAMDLAQSTDTMLVAHNTTYSFRNADGPRIRAEGAGAHATIVNNIFVSTTQPAISLGGSIGRDHNVLSNGSDLGPNSFIGTPDFEDPERDLHLGECAFEDLPYQGIAGFGIVLDIDREGRDPAVPFRGADEPDGAPPQVFEAPMAFESGTSSFLMASGDLDGDGDTDLAVTNVTAGAGSNDVTILLNDGSGILSAPVHLPFGSEPTHIEVGHLNADDVLDIVVVASDGVFQRIGTGGGVFAAPVEVAGPSEYTDLELADYDNDGDTDILLLTSPPTDSATVIARVNDGLGSYTFSNVWRVSQFADDLALADLDNDGFLDLLFVDNTSTNRLFTGRSRGIDRPGVSAGFDPPVAYEYFVETVPAASQFMIGDFDGDLDVDVVLGDAAADSLVLLRNNGDGMFGAREAFEAHGRSAPRLATALDYEGDGDLDIVSASASSQVDLILNDGFGNFSRFALCRSGVLSGFPNSIVASNLDEDGSPDVAVLTTNDSVDILTNLNWVSAISSEEPDAIPAANSRLLPNYPNPFSQITNVPYTLREDSRVKLIVFDLLGRHVATIVDEFRLAGRHVESFDSSRLAGGIYLYRMSAGAFVDTGRMAVIR